MIRLQADEKLHQNIKRGMKREKEDRGGGDERIDGEIPREVGRSVCVCVTEGGRRCVCVRSSPAASTPVGPSLLCWEPTLPSTALSGGLVRRALTAIKHPSRFIPGTWNAFMRQMKVSLGEPWETCCSLLKHVRVHPPQAHFHLPNTYII